MEIHSLVSSMRVLKTYIMQEASFFGMRSLTNQVIKIGKITVNLYMIMMYTSLEPIFVCEFLYILNFLVNLW